MDAWQPEPLQSGGPVICSSVKSTKGRAGAGDGDSGWHPQHREIDGRPARRDRGLGGIGDRSRATNYVARPREHAGRVSPVAAQ
jgi:hypothetical protein